MLHIAQVLNSTAASISRDWRGTVARTPKQRPEQLLELYEFEGCPYCRKVREKLTELDLDVHIYPCPKNGTRFRPVATKLGGQQQFPFLIDPNTGTQMYESRAIIEYLCETYGSRPASAEKAPLRNSATSTASSLLRQLKGVWAKPSRKPEQALELFSFESSPYSRLVRERLSELEVPYVLRNTGKVMKADMGPSWVRTRFYPSQPIKGPKRQELLERGGKLQVPYLADPNTGTAMYQSKAILQYLDTTYGR